MIRILVVYDRNRGVGQYFQALRSIPSDVHTYFRVGKSTRAESALVKVSRHLTTTSKFVYYLLRRRPHVVHLNPSLSIRSLLPASVYLILSKLCRSKVLIFLHGWDPSTERLLERRKRSRRRLLGLADAFIVLSRDYREALERWGIQTPIYVETTAVQDDWTKDIDLAAKLRSLQRKGKWNILFVAEVLSEKGVFVAIDAIRILQLKGINVELVIAGDGKDLARAQEHVRSTRTDGVSFRGYVTGNEKQQVFEQSDIFCLPTALSEGLPVAVVEAMYFGLPVVTRAVGGLKDLFERTVFGCITDSNDALVIAEEIQRLISDADLYVTIAWNNYTYCRNKLLASTASKRLRCIYDAMCVGQANNR